jgi:hypothetical protein
VRSCMQSMQSRGMVACAGLHRLLHKLALRLLLDGFNCHRHCSYSHQ